MEESWLNSRWVFINLAYGILVLCSNSGLESSAIAATTHDHGNETDRLALLDFKNLITQDPLRIMSSWNDSVHFCNWFGVSCNLSNKRVITLNLESKKLAGSIPPSVGNLTYLIGINLKNNTFYGEIPQEMGRLWSLKHINLTYNSFGGKIPINLTSCKELTVIEASGNNLLGEIPEQLSSLSKLIVLGLGRNNLTGTIPTWIGNFSSLFGLSIALNNFHGNIPNELGLLSRLGFFQLYGNYLSEYGLAGQVSTLGDVYSYGILLLEMFTGKRPTDDMFKVDLSIHRFVEMALREHVMDVIDQTMLVEKEKINEDYIDEIAVIKDNDAHANTSTMEEWLASAMRIGLACSSRSPSNRMAMNFVVNKLHDIRDSFLRSKNKNREYEIDVKTTFTFR